MEDFFLHIFLPKCKEILIFHVTVLSVDGCSMSIIPC